MFIAATRDIFFHAPPSMLNLTQLLYSNMVYRFLTSDIMIIISDTSTTEVG